MNNFGRLLEKTKIIVSDKLPGNTKALKWSKAELDFFKKTKLFGKKVQISKDGGGNTLIDYDGIDQGEIELFVSFSKQTSSKAPFTLAYEIFGSVIDSSVTDGDDNEFDLNRIIGLSDKEDLVLLKQLFKKAENIY